ncbi:ComF family protein [Streptomyces mobaraensis]|uniref:Phosphoribosyltransferase n=1 Tax=Streptomyces mobaraensis (strain ATCC 29032 / DSM 40847 / JCM 4168 / NBRC 13819 / NCIMB 11159 / IPCR 16-22) TaxID=1223523 RepID=M3BI35_STRM1|nr:ComF family protein [Streptomyces mobaraensis]EME99244.1 phosphoribosyltransferase [Streptomyces mobaraensis NBRC 13819 = DSM 40847]
MRGWWQEIAGLVFPADCSGCGAARRVLCEECREELSARSARRAWPDPVPAGLPPVYAAAWYADAVRSVLLAHKERGALALAEALGGALADAVYRAGTGGAGRGARGLGGPLLLVPVPSARRAVARRGHDPVRRLAMAAAGVLRRSGAEVRVAPVLRQRRAVADQVGLDGRARRANVAGALAVPTGAARLWAGGAAVVLVDDLMTTGASLAEAARAVGEVGGRVAGAAVVAVPPREAGRGSPGRAGRPGRPSARPW